MSEETRLAALDVAREMLHSNVEELLKNATEIEKRLQDTQKVEKHPINRQALADAIAADASFLHNTVKYLKGGA
jgi:hypothetical protein